MPKIIVFLGPTGSGKTELSLALAREFNGEIISADSRQVYKFLNIGSAKPLGEWRTTPGGEAYVVSGVAHYLMDRIDPREVFTVADFKKEALAHIQDITARGRVPFVVGGTGLYIQVLVDNWEIPPVAPAATRRQKLVACTPAELAAELVKQDPATASHIDLKNPRRVARALEVMLQSGKSFWGARQKGLPLVKPLMIGLRWGSEELRVRLKARVALQFKQGITTETERLLAAGYSLGLPSLSGIGYREAAAYLAGECTLAEAEQKIEQAAWQYARRQKTWFKRDQRIRWINGADVTAARALVNEFLEN